MPNESKPRDELKDIPIQGVSGEKYILLSQYQELQQRFRSALSKLGVAEDAAERILNGNPAEFDFITSSDAEFETEMATLTKDLAGLKQQLATFEARAELSAIYLDPNEVPTGATCGMIFTTCKLSFENACRN